jgi:hypothetical protein
MLPGTTRKTSLFLAPTFSDLALIHLFPKLTFFFEQQLIYTHRLSQVFTQKIPLVQISFNYFAELYPRRTHHGLKFRTQLSPPHSQKYCNFQPLLKRKRPRILHLVLDAFISQIDFKSTRANLSSHFDFEVFYTIFQFAISQPDLRSIFPEISLKNRIRRQVKFVQILFIDCKV